MDNHQLYQIINSNCSSITTWFRFKECYEYLNEGESYDRAPSRECKHPGVWSNVVEMCTRKQCDARQPASEQHIRYSNRPEAGFLTGTGSDRQEFS